MSVLVLNSAYEPIQTVSPRKAIKLIVRGVAIAEKYTEEVWRGVTSEIIVPSVVRLLNFYKIPNRIYRLSKRNIFARDNWTCQYCKDKLTSSNGTLDHVVPRSRGGESSWENLVTACKPCNSQKGNRTPNEAGMKLAVKGLRLNYRAILRNHGASREEWHEYLFLSA